MLTTFFALQTSLRKSTYMRFILILFLFHTSISIAQSFKKFKHYQLYHKKIGAVDFHTSGEGPDKPLLIYLDGSGAYPLFQKVSQGMASTVMLDIKKVTEKYCLVLISKPSVAFIDSTSMNNPQNNPIFEPEYYRKTLSLDWRAEAANQVINFLVAKKEFKNQKVILLGFSEGAQVAPLVANKNKRVTHLMCMGGNGLNHLFDPIIQVRLKMYAGYYTPDQAQQIIDSLKNQYVKIYQDPNSTEKQWWGHTYKRWSSFDSKMPVEMLLKLNIPIYWVNGGLDDNPILSSDFIAISFIRAGKNNFTHKVYPNYDHQLNEHVLKDGKETSTIPRYREVMKEAFDWLDNHFISAKK